MKVATNYPDALALLGQLMEATERDPIQRNKCIGIDIGRQFGTKIVMHGPLGTGRKLIFELEKRGLPCPQLIFLENPARILIGVEP